MHELSIVQSIIGVVQDHLPAGEIRGVKSVKLKVGELAGIVSESLEFCFELAVEGTALHGAKLKIDRVSGDELNVVEVELRE